MNKNKLDKLINALKEKYEYGEDELEEKITDLMDKLDSSDVNSGIEKIKNTIEKSLSESVDSINIIECIKRNPVKSLGLSLLAGMLASIVFLRR